MYIQKKIIIRRCGPPVYPIDRLTSTHTQKCGARSAAPVSDQGFGSLGLANNTYRQTEIFPLEFPLVKVSIGTRKPLRFTPDSQRIDLTGFRITVQQGQVRAIFSAGMNIITEGSPLLLTFLKASPDAALAL